MKLVVTGASGFVGRALIRELTKAGHVGLAVSRRPINELSKGWEWVHRDSFLERTYFNIDAVVHLEVKHHAPNPTPQVVAEFESVNVGGTLRWLAWCSQSLVKRFVYFSTIKAVASGTECVTEYADRNSDSEYGRSKARAEKEVANWVQQSPSRSGLILRPAVIYGRGNTANMFAFIQAIDRGRFLFIGKNENIKSLVSLQNVVNATRWLLERMQPGVDVYNLSDPRSYSVRELAEMISRKLGRRPPRSIPRSLAKVAALAGDILAATTKVSVPLTSARLRALTEVTNFSPAKLLNTGWQPVESTETGLSAMIEWYRSTTGCCK